MTNPHYEAVKRKMLRQPKTWLVTGCAGFIGSHLIETLLKLNQKVVGLDNFATGHRRNLKLVRRAVGEKAWKRFHFFRGDIRRLNDCYKAFGLKYKHPTHSTQYKELKAINRRSKVDIVLHQAALGSVPRSIKNPLSTHEVNVTGFVNMLMAARDAGVRRFVYASSSSVYGDSKELPKKEERIGNQLSPYAVSKYTNELYAKMFGRCYGLETVGLRYFNVFGARQDPNGPYAAVIPRWIAAIKKGAPVQIYGDGKTSRDFCYVDNAVQANLIIGPTKNKKTFNQVFNVACGARITLNELYKLIARAFRAAQHPMPGNRSGRGKFVVHPENLNMKKQELPKAHFLPKRNQLSRKVYLRSRAGDIRHSLADVSRISFSFDYKPINHVKDGIIKLLAENS